MKKTNDRGLYRRRGSPHWWIRYSDGNGKIIRESTCTTEKKLARQILAKKKVLVAEGKHLEKRKVVKTTFYQLCKRYWELEGKHKRTKGLDSMIEIWKQGIGNVPLKDLKQRQIEQFLNERMEAKNLSPATRNRYVAHLSSMFNKGIEWGLCVDNPAAGIKPLREKGARTRFLDTDEIQRLLNAASTEFRPILVTALHTGMRRGEILNLKWSDVDLRNRIITVQESKSGQKRMIPMDDTLAESLRERPSRFRRGYVFPSPVNPNRPRTDIKRQFRNALQGAEISDLRFHDLRHTFASHLVMSGVDIKTVQELLGHHDLSMTMKYAHLAPDHRMRAIKTLDKALQTGTKTDTVQFSGKDQSL